MDAQTETHQTTNLTWTPTKDGKAFGARIWLNLISSRYITRVATVLVKYGFRLEFHEAHSFASADSDDQNALELAARKAASDLSKMGIRVTRIRLESKLLDLTLASTG